MSIAKTVVAEVVLQVGLATLALCQANPQSGADTKFNFETPGERVSVLLQDWSSRFGIIMSATKSTADEVVVIRLQDVSHKQAMDRLAEVLHATWMEKSNHWYLSRSDRQDREQRDADRQQEIDEIRKVQQDMAEKLAAAGPFDQAGAAKLAKDLDLYLNQVKPGGSSMAVAQQGMQLNSRGPIGRAVARLALLIPAEDIADLPIRIRTVYSTAPTKLQRQLPPGAAEVLKQAIQDQEAWVQALQGKTYDRETGFAAELASNTSAFSEPPTRALLAVFRLSRNTKPSFELILSSSKGHVVVRTQNGAFFSNGYGRARPTATSEQVLVVPDDVRAYSAIFIGQGRAKIAITDDQKARLTDPIRFDPLSFVAGPAVLAAAKAKNENLVALLDDQQWLTGVNASRSQINVERFLFQMRNSSVVTESSGWMLLRPRSPSYARDYRADRAVLGAFLKTKLKNKPLTIEQATYWVTNLPRTEENRMPSSLAASLAGRSGDQTLQEDLVRLYGGLTSEQRAAAKSSQGLAVLTFSEESMNALNRLVFGLGMSLQLNNTVRNGPLFDQDWFSGLGREPTEMLGEGITAEARLHITETSGPMAMMTSNSILGPPRYMLARELAMMLNQQSISGFQSRHGPDTGPPQYFFGKGHDLNFRIDFTPQVYYGPAKLTEVDLLSEEPVAYADLPADFRSEVDSRLAELQKRFMNRRVSPPVQLNPPP